MEKAYDKYRKAMKHLSSREISKISSLVKPMRVDYDDARALMCEGYIYYGLTAELDKREQKRLFKAQWEEVCADEVEYALLQPCLARALKDAVQAK